MHASSGTGSRVQYGTEQTEACDRAKLAAYGRMRLRPGCASPILR